MKNGYGRLEELIENYTIDQIEHFASIASGDERERVLKIATAVRVGFNADKKDWAIFVRAFSRQDRQKTPKKVSSPEEIRALQGLMEVNKNAC